MAEKTIKALVTKVSPKAEPGGIEYNWDSLTSRMPSFTNNIITPAIAIDKDGKSEVSIGAIVSGMPTVFARSNLFYNALNSITDKNAEVDGLLGFYKSLVDEWRGFIACIALNYQDVEVRRINLSYSDGKKIGETQNIYEPKGAFGNVLFERRPLWFDQTLPPNADRNPFIDVIKYKSQVVGGTSPECFLFTSVAYQLNEKASFINVKNRNFTDPLNSNLQRDELNRLYGYVKLLNNNIEKFRTQFDQLEDDLRPRYENINGNLQDWLKEMDAYAQQRGLKIDEQIPELSIFVKPFDVLFNHSTQLYGRDGIIQTEDTSGSFLFDPKNLLLPEGTEIAKINFGKEGDEKADFLKDHPIYVLQTETKGEKGFYNYFALPLTPLALNVFGNNLGALVGVDTTTNIKSRLLGIYDPENDILEVKLVIYTSLGKEIVKSQKYKVVDKSIENQDILLWPNFISKKWNRYFMYSELPHNEDQFQATPFVGYSDEDYFKILSDSRGIPFYLSEKGKVRQTSEVGIKDRLQSTLHIVSDYRVADNAYKYEIYESNLPFKGLKFSYSGQDCGYLIIRYKSEPDAILRNKLQDSEDLSEANLGIDFGSTNTSVAYYSKKYQSVSKGIKFKNRRVSLLANDNKNNDIQPAVENEIFFFQNDEVQGNSIKSLLTLHDPKRWSRELDSHSNESKASQAVMGGFPCFEKNLPIDDASDNRYYLKYPKAGRPEIVHNMKWSTQSIENSYKTAYLSSLLLHIYAQLFDEGHRPVSLKWSYPSSMSNNLIRQYNQIWTTLGEVNPILPHEKLIIYNPVINIDLSSQTGSSWGDTSKSPKSSWGNSGNIQTSDNWGSVENGSNGSGWGSNVSSNPVSGWGTTPEPQAKSTSAIKDINTELGPRDFKFKILGSTDSLTEACAVANYIANSGKISTDPRFLTICFDVGGSTTDIMALAMMNGPNELGLAMVKQSSIRFAAQRVSKATSYSTNFKAIMIEMCERKKITIQGLNKGENKFTSNTAPYYFEQLVDRLDDNDFPQFYQLLAGRCPELMCVNLYVTGLIMFYAGQLALKLRSEVANSPNRVPGMDNWKPIVNVVFAGKGARIFDWLKAINQQQYSEYYTNLFIKGFGGMEKAQGLLSGPPIINPTNSEGSNDIKYEVSKGLAQTTGKLYVPLNNVAIELVGEDNFIVITSTGEQKQIKSEDSITNEMMEHIGSYFLPSHQGNHMSVCPRFMEFAEIYYKLASQLFALPLTQQDFMEGFNNMNIASYIKQLPEYKMANESKRTGETEVFDYVAPIIILEGMKFLEEVILKKISK
ncbi:MAG: hypothetical protein H6Q15_2070 [Bacteroidetes bacterium]|nr:hypothetical protein [Bacteroidota bacterium]